MALQEVVLVLLICCASLTTSQSCGSQVSCSQDYDHTCPPDDSCDLYDAAKLTQSSCSTPIGPTPSPTVDCYDMCVLGAPTPLQCCADSISNPGVIDVTTNPEFQIARLYSLDDPSYNYRSNTFCKYNVQCPSEDFNLFYTMVEFSVEPPHTNGQCLDFMRYHFTATGVPVTHDLCGDMAGLPNILKSGVHGSGLTLDFRSNRINAGSGFFLALTCTLPSAASSRKKKQIHSSSIDQVQVRQTCIPSQTFNAKVGRDFKQPLKTTEEYFKQIFPTQGSSPFSTQFAKTVTRGSVVKYKENNILVEHNGVTTNRYTKIRTLHVYNEIEGYLRFIGSSNPPDRTFPGFGFLRIGRRGTAQYIQTIVDPKFLLSHEEELIVYDLFEEIHVRERLDGAQQNFEAALNCSINRLAELNVHSCSDTVRAVANFFLKTDTFQNFCG